MSKDFPALRMTVEGGRLVPATPFDAERINSYRNKSLVLVKLAPPKDRVQIRKWFAILGLVVKQCQTPWDNVDQAHEAIKLALGIVDLSKTVSGQFMAVPKSLTELDDPELDEAVLQMIDLLSRMTGVDVATLRKEAADVGQAIAEEEQANTDDAAPASAASGEAGADEIPAASVPASPSLSRTDRTDLKDCARQFFGLTSDPALEPKVQRGLLEQSKDKWKAHLPAELHEHVKSLFLSADAVIKGDADRSAALSEVCGWLECEPEEIGG